MPQLVRTNLIQDVHQVSAIMNSIDLSMVKRKIMDPEEGQGWTLEHAEEMEMRYRRYLTMLYLKPHSSIVPTRDIDLYWHQHILDTRAYAADCEKAFGFFVHHFPYFGMRDEEDARNLESSFEETKTFYYELYAEDYCAHPADHPATAVEIDQHR